jgi:hypothetical protein
VISRRSFLAGALVACGGTPASVTAENRAWVTPWLGAPPTRILVLRRPGNPHDDRGGDLFEKVHETLLPPQALASCAGSEHYFVGNTLVLSIARGVPPGFDPRAFLHPPAVCASGGGCGPYWKLVGQSANGVARFTEPGESRTSVYSVPNGTWIGVDANSAADLRLGPALASSVVPMPASDLEPTAMQVEHTKTRGEAQAVFASYAGAELVSATTVAVFAPPGGASVPYLVRAYLPDGDRARAAASDINRQRAELRTRDPRMASLLPEDVRVEGSTIVQRMLLTRR